MLDFASGKVSPFVIPSAAVARGNLYRAKASMGEYKTKLSLTLGAISKNIEDAAELYRISCPSKHRVPLLTRAQSALDQVLWQFEPFGWWDEHHERHEHVEKWQVHALALSK
jgi:hypothetical protein